MRLNSNILIGGIVLAIGLFITFGTLAASDDGSYTMAWGAIIVGIIMLGKGIAENVGGSGFADEDE